MHTAGTCFPASGLRSVAYCFFSSVLCGRVGFQVAVVPLELHGDELRTDVDGIAHAIDALGSDRVLCVVTTSSCFAPRAPDK